ncbi:taurine transporter substrate binding subunit [Enterobacter cloacae]|uniref:Taurine transporter substrate binding subunit n=1 Tax=Enterobacter cloacae TaxID=550 RepID=A0A377M5R9_ENTCL|nr:taurine transporter substrate binding subunit [Enterobacter cloacae]
MAITSRITLLGALALWAFQAQAVDVTVAYQTSAELRKSRRRITTLPKRAAQTSTGVSSTAGRPWCVRLRPARADW